MEKFDLDAAIKDCELHEWTPEAIEAYKRAAVAKAPPPSTAWEHRKAIVVCARIAVTVGLMAVCAIIIGFVYSAWFVVLVSITAFVGMGVGTHFLDKAMKSTVKPAIWETEHFNFHGDIPTGANILLRRMRDSGDSDTNAEVFVLRQYRASGRSEWLGSIFCFGGRYLAVSDEKRNIVLPPGIEPDDESKHTLVVDGSMKLHDMIRAARMRRDDTEINAKRFPVDPSLAGRWLWKIYPWQEEMESPEAVAAIMAKNGFVLARHEHGLAFEAQFPMRHPSWLLICAGWQSKHSWHNFEEVLCFSTMYGRVTMELIDDIGWYRMEDRGNYFLGVRRAT